MSNVVDPKIRSKLIDQLPKLMKLVVEPSSRSSEDRWKGEILSAALRAGRTINKYGCKRVNGPDAP